MVRHGRSAPAARPARRPERTATLQPARRDAMSWLPRHGRERGRVNARTVTADQPENTDENYPAEPAERNFKPANAASWPLPAQGPPVIGSVAALAGRRLRSGHDDRVTPAGILRRRYLAPKWSDGHRCAEARSSTYVRLSTKQGQW